jgi:hypothetical protein
MTFKPTTGRRILSDMAFIVLDRKDQLDRRDNEQRSYNARGQAAGYGRRINMRVMETLWACSLGKRRSRR